MKNKVKILVVEDHESTRLMIEKILIGMGYEVFGTDDGESAILMAERIRPDLILMDHILKEGITGYEAAKVIKKSVDIPVVLVTSMPAEGFLDDMGAANLFGFVNKPFKANSLKFVIENALYKYKMSRKLEDSEHRSRVIFDNVNVGIVIIDKEAGEVENINRFTETLIGLKREEVVGREWGKFVNYREQAAALHGITGNGEREDYETEIVNRDGTSIPVIVTRTPMRLREKDYFIESITDVSELYRVKKKLQSIGDRYHQLFQDSKDIVFISSAEGNFIDINSAGVELFGYSSKEEMKNINISKDLYCSADMRDIILKKLLEKGYVKDFQLEMKAKDGKKITTQITAHAYMGSDGRLKEIVGFIKDISQKMEDEIMLLKMNAELLEINQKLQMTQVTLVQQEKLASIGQLAAGVAHELNNPLGFVHSNFEALEDYISVFKEYIDMAARLYKIGDSVEDPEVKNIISDMRKFEEETDMGFMRDDLKAIFEESKDGVSRLVKIVNNLRSFSRIDESSQFDSFDLNKGIENTLVISNNSFKYVADVETDLGDIPFIECNGGEVNQVILNIIVNAAQAIESMNRQEMGKIRIKTEEDKEGFIKCEISDDGPGIPSEIVNKIFDPFFTTKEIGKGTGLGLNIAYNIIVNKHKGDLQVASSSEEGTTFTIILPVKSSLQGDQDE